MKASSRGYGERTGELERLNAALAEAKFAAEAANVSKTRFLAAASHDILQPLNAARLYVTSLVERGNAGEEARLVNNVDASLEAVEDIIAALLEISRLDAGAMTPDIAAFRIDELLRPLELDFAPLAEAKGIALDFVRSSLTVRSDRRLLRRLMQNLVSNAIKYTRSGRVLVGCRRRGNRLRIDVYDTGIGIPPHQQRAVFHEFHRLEQGARQAPGLGLGLSIVERIARVLDHPLGLVSESGRGSHFSVEVPLAPAAPQRAAAAGAAARSRARRRDRALPRQRCEHSRRHGDAAARLGLRGAHRDRARRRHRGGIRPCANAERAPRRLSPRSRQRHRCRRGAAGAVRPRPAGGAHHRRPLAGSPRGRPRGGDRGAQQAAQAGGVARGDVAMGVAPARGGGVSSDAW